MAERPKRQCINRELPYWRFRMSSNPAAAVAPFGKALYPHFFILKSIGGDFKPSVPCIGESHPMQVKEPTSLLAKEQGEILVKWSDSQTYGNR